MKKCIVAAMGGALATFCGTHGSVIVQTQTFGPASLESSPPIVTFNKFDGTLAELVSIKFQFDLEIQGGSLSLDNDSNSPLTGIATLGAKVNFLFSPDVVLLNRFGQPTVGVNIAADEREFNLAGNDGDPAGFFDKGGSDYFSFAASPVSISDQDDISIAFFSGFLGTGSFNVGVSMSSFVDVSPLGGVLFTSSPVSASGRITITYEYEKTHLPEPGALGLAGLGGLIALRRRR